MTNTNAPAPMTNPLSALALSRIIALSLPRNTTPQLKNTTDAIAIACHAGMISVGFGLIGLGEDHHIDAHADSSDMQPLPAEWNSSSAAHAFRYKHTQSSLEYLLKVSRLGNKTVVYGIGVGDDKTATFDVTTRDYTSESSLPASPSSSLPADQQNSASPAVDEASIRSISDIFISPSRLSDLGSLLKLNIIQKLIPSLQKEGYEDTSSSTAGASTSAATRSEQPRSGPSRPDRDPTVPLPALPHPLADPSVGGVPPRRPQPVGDFPPPGFEDEYELQRPPRRPYPFGGEGGGDGYYPSIGERDLYPPGMGPHDPLRVGGVGPLGPLGGGGAGMGGGMHPTFDDPIFGGGRRGYDAPGGYDPQAPPGARYDPVGPDGGDDGSSDPLRVGGPRGGGRGRGRGGGGSGGLGPFRPGLGGFDGPPNPFGGFGSDDFI